MLFLLFALALSALLGWFVVWQARRPKSLEDGIDEFSRGLDALAPPDDRRHTRDRRDPDGRR